MQAVAEGLLEREAPFAALEEALGAVVGRRSGRLVLVTAEAGGGKTALLRGFAEAAGRSARVLWAACDALATPRPLGPLLDLDGDGELATLVRAGAAPHEVCRALLAELDGPAPALLVLEDAHWVDEATLDVLRLLVRRLDGVPALVVVSFRDEQVERAQPLRVLLGELPAGVRRLALAGLSPTAVAELAGEGVDAQALHARTGGNPFFVTEVLAGGGALPDSVRDAVLARAARLDEHARAVLDAVAVVPRRTPVALLEAVLGAPADAGLDACLAAGVLRDDGDGVAFRHELARLAVEGSLAPHRRVALHRAVLAALAAGSAPDLARLAHHAEAAGDGGAVLRWAPAAAEHAAAVGGHREAEAHFARALRFAGTLAPADRAVLLRRFAEETYLTDMREEGVAALAEVVALHRAQGNARALGEALRLRARLLSCLGRAPEAVADVEAAIGVLEAEPPGPELARALAARAGQAMVQDDVAGTIAWGHRALAVAAAADDRTTEAQVLNSVGTMRLSRGEEAGRAQLQRSLALALELGSVADAGRGYINLVSALARRRRWPEADPVLAEGIAWTREQGLDAWLDCLEAGAAASALAQGRWDAAGRLATAVLPRCAGHAGPRLDALVVLALLRARRGDPGAGEALAELDEIVVAADGQLQFLGPVALARAEVEWLRGRPAAADEATARAAALAQAQGDGWWAAELLVWRRRLGLEAAEADTLDGPFARAISGDHAGAAAELRVLGCDHDAALVAADAGTEPALRDAHATLLALGARPAAAVLARRLRELGARDVAMGPRAATAANPAGLTARELEVVALLAEGLTNAELAERLVVSQKTVAHHVSAVLRKLGVARRGQAAARARELGLVP